MAERINVLHLNAPLTVAGAEKVLLLYLENYNRQNFFVKVASFINTERNPFNPFPYAVQRAGGEFLQISISRRIDWRDILKVIQAIRAGNIHIIHTHGYRADIIGLIAARLCRIKIVSTVHGWTPVSDSLRLYEILDRMLLRYFDRVIVVSQPIADTLIGKKGKDSRIKVLANAVSLSENSGRDDRRAEVRASIRRECGVKMTDYVAGV